MTYGPDNPRAPVSDVRYDSRCESDNRIHRPTEGISHVTVRSECPDEEEHDDDGDDDFDFCIHKRPPFDYTYNIEISDNSVNKINNKKMVRSHLTTDHLLVQVRTKE